MATQPIVPPMTVEEFVREYGDDNSLELIDGDVCEREVNGLDHFYIKNKIKDLFGAAGIRNFGFGCFVEASFRLTPKMGVTPDLSVLRLDRLRGLGANPILKGAPEIPFEVSISDKASVLERKLAAYLASGAHAVCLVFPESRSVHVYTEHEWRRLTEADTLEFPDLLPGLAIPVAAIFADLGAPPPHNE